MSDITSYTYPEVFTLLSNEGADYVGDKAYTKDRDAYHDTTGAYKEIINLQWHPQTDPYTRPLIVDLAQYNNGTELRLEYFTEDHSLPAPGYVKVTGKTVLVDSRTKEVITTPTGSDIDAEHSFNMNVALKNGDQPLAIEEFPFYYVPSRTNYIGSGETHVGDPAQSIAPFGYLVTSNDPEGHPISNWLGVVDESTDINWRIFTYHTIDNCIINSEDDLQDFINDFTEAGNGNNPVGDPVSPSNNPFENQPSNPGGGKGPFEKEGDITGPPGLPSSGVLGSGFIAMYAPTQAQLQSLGAKLWSSDFMETFLKLWNDPMEAIISLGLVPFTPPSSGTTNCYIGNYDTEISMNRVTSQYITLSCGSNFISEYWGSALDYAPYTEAEIYLPFVGMRTLDIDDIMDKTVSVDYNIDLLGGEAIAYVMVNNRVLYDFRCNVMTSVPISSSSYASLYSNLIKGVSSAAVGAAVGGGVGAAAGALTSAVNVVTSKHSTVERGGDSTPNSGTLGVFMPYIILHRSVQSLPSGFGRFKGYPSNITRTLSAISGYTEVEYIHLDGINATEEEKEEIYSLLKAGVML